MSGMRGLLQRLNADLSGLAAQVHASLVRVETVEHGSAHQRPGGPIGRSKGAGAGTIWHSHGLILTSAHVADRRRLEVVLSDGSRLAARILAHDRDLDLAALSVEAANLPTIELGDSRSLKPGHWVMAFGHPWGVAGAATAGVVIGLGAALPERPAFGKDWIAVSLHYRPGHSGGPLVDAEGKLVGINTVMAGPDVGLAVPIHAVKEFLKDRLGRAVPGELGEVRAA